MDRPKHNPFEVLSTNSTVPVTGDEQPQPSQQGHRKSTNRGGQRGRRIKCTFPTCGKFGHFTSQCWKAHPELRPHGSSSTRDGRGRRGGRGRGRGALDNMSALDWALPPRSPSPPTIPFRFFDLPQEIQDKVYEVIYAEKHGVNVHISGPLQDHGRRRRGYGDEEEVEELQFNGRYYGDDGLKRACNRMRNDSYPARKAAFNGKMYVAWDDDYSGRAFEDLRADKYATVRGEITDLSFSGISGRSCSDLPSDFWDDIHTLFPQVETIKANYSMYRRQHVDRDSDEETSEWRRIMAEDYDEAFEAGDMDDEFDFPAERLQLLNLARSLEEASQACIIFLETSVTWTDNRYHAVHWQHLKFLVSADGLKGVERKP